MTIHDPKPGWLDKQKNVKKILGGLIVLAVMLFLADAVYEKHPHFAAEEWFGFYALYSGLVFIGIIIVGKVLHLILGRDKNYYDGSDGGAS